MSYVTCQSYRVYCPYGKATTALIWVPLVRASPCNENRGRKGDLKMTHCGLVRSFMSSELEYRVKSEYICLWASHVTDPSRPQGPTRPPG